MVRRAKVLVAIGALYFCPTVGAYAFVAILVGTEKNNSGIVSSCVLRFIANITRVSFMFNHSCFFVV